MNLTELITQYQQQATESDNKATALEVKLTNLLCEHWILYYVNIVPLVSILWIVRFISCIGCIYNCYYYYQTKKTDYAPTQTSESSKTLTYEQFNSLITELWYLFLRLFTLTMIAYKNKE